MASPNIYPGGLNLAGTVFANGPATLQRDGAVYLAGAVQWLDTISGNDASAGTEPELPVKTLAQAVTNSTTNGVIIIGAGSAESLAASQSLAIANLSIFGCGTGSSRPRYTNANATSLFDITGAGTWIEGIYSPASTTAPTNRVAVGAAAVTLKDCYFECGASDTVPTLAVGSSGNQFTADGCSFVVTASRPSIGIRIAATVTDPTVRDCVFDGGSYGWSDYALKVTAAATRIRVFGGTYINRSDIGITVTATSYSLFGIETDGTSRVTLTA